jgi:hypothetical protein
MRLGLLAPSRRFEDAFLHPAQALFAASGDNLGNFAFVEALWRHLSPDVEILPWHVSPGEAREKCDVLVLAAANQLGAHNDLGSFAHHLERIDLPIVVVGLGAQAPDMAASPRLSPGTERWAHTLAAHAPSDKPNIGVRGAFTRRTLEKLGLGAAAAVIGCPSNFLNDARDFYPGLSRRVAAGRIERLCVAAGSRHFGATREVERRLARMVEQTQGLYVAQADLAMVRLARGEIEAVDPAEAQAVADWLGVERADFPLWLQRRAACFSDATSWLAAMRPFDFAVGARFHGIMLAIQAGVPGGVIAHDSRTLELCQTMALPVRLGAEAEALETVGDLPELFGFDVPGYAATRERLRKAYLDLLRGAGIEPSPRLATPQSLSG